MTQPNVYWTLETPFANIIGLYSNVPEGGEIHQEQFDWFVNELSSARRRLRKISKMHLTNLAEWQI
jgi:hypothetical protein